MNNQYSFQPTFSGQTIVLPSSLASIPAVVASSLPCEVNSARIASILLAKVDTSGSLDQERACFIRVDEEVPVCVGSSEVPSGIWLATLAALDRVTAAAVAFNPSSPITDADSSTVVVSLSV